MAATFARPSRSVRKRAVVSPIDEARAARRHGSAFSQPSQESGCVAHRRGTGGKKAWQLPSQDLARSQESGWGAVESVWKTFSKPSQESKLRRPSTRHGRQEGMAATFARPCGAFAGERLGSCRERLEDLLEAFARERLCRPSTRHGRQEGMAATFARPCGAFAGERLGSCRERLEDLLEAFAGEQVASPIDEARAARRHGSYLRKAFSECSQESGCVAHRRGTGGKKAWQLPSQDLLEAFAGERLGRCREPSRGLRSRLLLDNS